MRAVPNPIAAFKKANALFTKVNKLVSDEMLVWGDDAEAITAHIVFLGMIEAQTTHSIETCPMPEEAKTLLRVAAASDFKDMVESFKKDGLR